MLKPLKKLQANDLATTVLTVLIGIPVGTMLLWLVMVLLKNI